MEYSAALPLSVSQLISSNTTVTAINGLSITLSQNPSGNIANLNYIGLKKTEGRSVDIEYKISLDF